MGSLLSYILDLIFFVVVAKLLGRVFAGLFGPASTVRRQSGGQRVESSREHIGKTMRDPVCGMFVSTELSHRLVRGSETLHFCSAECLERYQKEMANASV